MSKKVLIMMDFFGSNVDSLAAVVNWGDEERGTILLNKNTLPAIKSKLESCFCIKTFDELDLNDSLYYWYKDNKDHIGKPIVIDETIEDGEIPHNQKASKYVVTMMVKATEDKILVKPIYN